MDATELMPEEIVQQLEDMKDELQDAVHEMACAWEIVHSILKDLNRFTGMRITTRQDTAGVEHFLGIQWYTGCGSQIDDILEEVDELIQAVQSGETEIE